MSLTWLYAQAFYGVSIWIFGIPEVIDRTEIEETEVIFKIL